MVCPLPFWNIASYSLVWSCERGSYQSFSLNIKIDKYIEFRPYLWGLGTSTQWQIYELSNWNNLLSAIEAQTSLLGLFVFQASKFKHFRFWSNHLWNKKKTWATFTYLKNVAVTQYMASINP